jgi:inosine-uridine nucleoside N-ribohydrolase
MRCAPPPDVADRSDSAGTSIPVIIDTDIGADPDDAIALAFALASPEIAVVGVTVATGDVGVRARMAARLLGMCGRADIPVFRGRSAPLDPNGKPAWVGTEGQGLLNLPYDGPEATIHETPAEEWIVERTRAERLHLIGIGPLTNIGAALRRDPELAHRLGGLTIMGGVYDRAALSPAWQRAIQNSDEAIWPDYNTASDAEGALICAHSGCPVTWITSEVTMRAPLRRGHLERLSLESPLGRALRGMAGVWRNRWFAGTLPPGDLGADVPEDSVCFLHDPLTVAAVLPGTAQWLTLTGAALDYRAEGGRFRLASDPSGIQANVSTRVVGTEFAEFGIDRIAALIASKPA